MNETELAQILRRMYQNAPKGEQKTAIHLFGIKYAEALSSRNVSSTRVAALSGIGDSYYTEINNGMRLAKYVELNERVSAHGLRLP